MAPGPPSPYPPNEGQALGVPGRLWVHFWGGDGDYSLQWQAAKIQNKVALISVRG